MTRGLQGPDLPGGLRPFERQATEIEASEGKLQVMLLAELPAAADREAVLAHATDADRLAFGERELYWLPNGPMSRSDLDLRAIEKRLGAVTTRTARTIERLAAKFF